MPPLNKQNQFGAGASTTSMPQSNDTGANTFSSGWNTLKSWFTPKQQSGTFGGAQPQQPLPSYNQAMQGGFGYKDTSPTGQQIASQNQGTQEKAIASQKNIANSSIPPQTPQNVPQQTNNQNMAQGQGWGSVGQGFTGQQNTQQNSQNQTQIADNTGPSQNQDGGSILNGQPTDQTTASIVSRYPQLANDPLLSQYVNQVNEGQQNLTSAFQNMNNAISSINTGTGYTVEQQNQIQQVQQQLQQAQQIQSQANQSAILHQQSAIGAALGLGTAQSNVMGQVSSMQNTIQAGTTALNNLNQNFTNQLNELTANFKSGNIKAAQDNYKSIQDTIDKQNKTLGDLVSKVQTAKNEAQTQANKQQQLELNIKKAQNTQNPLDAETINTVADYVAKTGTVPTGFSRNAVATAQIWNAVAQRTSGTDLATQKAVYSSNTAALRQVTEKYNNAKTSADAVEAQLPILQNLSNKVWRSGSPFLNKPVQDLLTTVTSDPNLSAFQNSIKEFTSEYSKVMTGSTGASGASDQSVRNAESLLNSAQSKDTFNAAIQNMQDMMKSRLDGYKQSVNEFQSSVASAGQATGQSGGFGSTGDNTNYAGSTW